MCGRVWHRSVGAPVPHTAQQVRHDRIPQVLKCVPFQLFWSKPHNVAHMNHTDTPPSPPPATSGTSAAAASRPPLPPSRPPWTGADDAKPATQLLPRSASLGAHGRPAATTATAAAAGTSTPPRTRARARRSRVGSMDAEGAPRAWSSLASTPPASSPTRPPSASASPPRPPLPDHGVAGAASAPRRAALHVVEAALRVLVERSRANREMLAAATHALAAAAARLGSPAGTGPILHPPQPASLEQLPAFITDGALLALLQQAAGWLAGAEAVTGRPPAGAAARLLLRQRGPLLLGGSHGWPLPVAPAILPELTRCVLAAAAVAAAVRDTPRAPDLLPQLTALLNLLVHLYQPEGAPQPAWQLTAWVLVLRHAAASAADPVEVWQHLQALPGMAAAAAAALPLLLDVVLSLRHDEARVALGLLAQDHLPLPSLTPVAAAAAGLPPPQLGPSPGPRSSPSPSPSPSPNPSPQSDAAASVAAASAAATALPAGARQSAHVRGCVRALLAAAAAAPQPTAPPRLALLAAATTRPGPLAPAWTALVPLVYGTHRALLRQPSLPGQLAADAGTAAEGLLFGSDRHLHAAPPRSSGREQEPLLALLQRPQQRVDAALAAVWTALLLPADCTLKAQQGHQPPEELGRVLATVLATEPPVLHPAALPLGRGPFTLAGLVWTLLAPGQAWRQALLAPRDLAAGSARRRWLLSLAAAATLPLLRTRDGPAWAAWLALGAAPSTSSTAAVSEPASPAAAARAELAEARLSGGRRLWGAGPPAAQPGDRAVGQALRSLWAALWAAAPPAGVKAVPGADGRGSGRDSGSDEPDAAAAAIRRMWWAALLLAPQQPPEDTSMQVQVPVMVQAAAAASRREEAAAATLLVLRVLMQTRHPQLSPRPGELHVLATQLAATPAKAKPQLGLLLQAAAEAAGPDSWQARELVKALSGPDARGGGGGAALPPTAPLQALVGGMQAWGLQVRGVCVHLCRQLLHVALLLCCLFALFQVKVEPLSPAPWLATSRSLPRLPDPSKRQLQRSRQGVEGAETAGGEEDSDGDSTGTQPLPPPRAQSPASPHQPHFKRQRRD